MDKKKVKELIVHSVLNIDRIVMGDIDGFEASVDIKRMLNDALQELSKSDWVSVEDGLPPYDKEVWVTSKMCPDNIFKDRRVECTTVKKDSNDFIILWNGRMAHITHWKPIEKLEEMEL